MKIILLFALLKFTFFDIFSNNQGFELNEANQYVLSIKAKQKELKLKVNT